MNDGTTRYRVRFHPAFHPEAEISMGGIDGIQLNCDIQQSNGAWAFSAWSPFPRHHPRQHGFVSAVLKLASDVTREPTTARLLVLLSSYLHSLLTPAPRAPVPPAVPTPG